jgi:hypothetical protein
VSAGHLGTGCNEETRYRLIGKSSIYDPRSLKLDDTHRKDIALLEELWTKCSECHVNYSIRKNRKHANRWCTQAEIQRRIQKWNISRRKPMESLDALPSHPGNSRREDPFARSPVHSFARSFVCPFARSLTESSPSFILWCFGSGWRCVCMPPIG